MNRKYEKIVRSVVQACKTIGPHNLDVCLYGARQMLENLPEIPSVEKVPINELNRDIEEVDLLLRRAHRW